MKRSVVVFVGCLVLVLAGVAAGVGMLRGDREQVEVTAEVISGDITAAEGFTACQSAISQNRLLWDLTIPLGQPESTETVFTYSREPLWNEPVSPHPLILWADWPTAFSLGYMEKTLLADPSLAPLLPICQEILGRVPAESERYEESFYLEDYLEEYPLLLTLTTPDEYRYTVTERQSHAAVSKALKEYFRFPVPPGTKWKLQVVGNDFAALGSQGDSSPGLELLGDWKDNIYYFTFGSESDPLLSYETIPGGFGLYRLVLAPEDESFSVVSLDTPYALPQGAEVLNLCLSTDKRDLLVSYGLGDTYTLLVFDPDTMELKQTLPIPAQPPLTATGYRPGQDGANIPYPYAKWDAKYCLAGDNSLLLAGDDTLYLFTRTDGSYQFAFSFPFEDGLDLDSIGLYRPCAVWNGEKLALGSVWGSTGTTETGLDLWVFENGELLYQGKYTTSLNQTAAQETDEPGVSVRESKALTITWTG